VRIGVAVLAGAVGLDLVAHVIASAVLEETAHVAVLIAMVATLAIVVLGQSQARPAPTSQQGDRHALR
jgi:hypothetical protein